MNLLEQLTQAGALGAGAIVPRTVEWNGQSLKLFFRDLSGAEVQKLLAGDGNTDPRIVEAALCNEDGSPALTAEQVALLKLPLRALIAREAMDVFGFSMKARADAKKD
jgi:hypothetical protein